LEAHPAQDESEVSFRICSRDIPFTSFPVRGIGILPMEDWLEANATE